MSQPENHHGFRNKKEEWKLSAKGEREEWKLSSGAYQLRRSPSMRGRSSGAWPPSSRSPHATAETAPRTRRCSTAPARRHGRTKVREKRTARGREMYVSVCAKLVDSWASPAWRTAVPACAEACGRPRSSPSPWRPPCRWPSQKLSRGGRRGGRRRRGECQASVNRVVRRVTEREERVL